MLRKALAFAVSIGVVFGAVACGAPGEKESSKAPLPEGQTPSASTTPDKASAGTPGELPPPASFRKK